MTLIRALLALIAFATVSACSPPGPPISIRPGIGQVADLDAIRPPSGVTYRYQMQSDGLDLPVELRLTSQRQSSTRYDYRGSLTMTLPAADNLEEIGALIAQSLELDELNVGIQGNKLIVPVSLRTDNRFRSVASSLVLVNSQYSPHDCFAVLGTCRYTASEGERSIALIAETQEEDGIWRTQTRPDPRKRQPGQRSGIQTLTYSIDKNAVLIDMVISSVERGRRSSVVFRRK